MNHKDPTPRPTSEVMEDIISRNEEPQTEVDMQALVSDFMTRFDSIWDEKTTPNVES